MTRLKDKVAIVTGGGTGIGEAICKKFAREGARVIVNGFPDDPIEDVVRAIVRDGGEAIPFAGDISEENTAKACILAAVDKWGRLDILINNAGSFPAIQETQYYPTEAFEFMIQHNVRNAVLMTKHALPELQKTRGCILFAGSEAGIMGIAQNTPYGGTKGFLHSFMKGVAAEQAKYGVRANCVCPGPIDTAWTHKETGPMPGKMEKMIISGTPMARRGTPEEVANVYLFLASDEASYVTGALYSVDGGITISKGPLGEEVPSELKEQPQSTLNLEHSMDGLTRIRNHS
jgi:NAD(P)-dependent dehydrogenase (short-subunit alcohol dehydrogenase family)